MIKFLPCLFIFGTALAQTYVPHSTVANTAGVQVTPAATLGVMQCTADYVDRCWPTYAGSVTSAVLGSLGPTAHVFAVVPPSTSPVWVQVNEVTVSSTTAPPPTTTPPATGTLFTITGSIVLSTSQQGLAPGTYPFTFTVFNP